MLCAELCLQEVRHVRPENDDFHKIHTKHTENTQERCSLLYESPGGNQVDGLPPVSHRVMIRRASTVLLRFEE